MPLPRPSAHSLPQAGACYTPPCLPHAAHCVLRRRCARCNRPCPAMCAAARSLPPSLSPSLPPTTAITAPQSCALAPRACPCTAFVAANAEALCLCVRGGAPAARSSAVGRPGRCVVAGVRGGRAWLSGRGTGRVPAGLKPRSPLHPPLSTSLLLPLQDCPACCLAAA